MIKEEIKAIKTHIEIHAKAEPRAIKITKILRKAVRELEENNRLEEKIADIKANCDLAIEGRDVKIKELETQIMKMRCCSNCRYKYKCCSWTSETIKDGKITSHYWNKEKQAYCDVGEGAETEYQLWEMK